MLQCMQGRRFRVGELSNLLFEFAGVPGAYRTRCHAIYHVVGISWLPTRVCQVMPCTCDVRSRGMFGPGVVGLHNGLPPAAAFPIKGITLRLDGDATIDISDPAEVHSSIGALLAPHVAAAFNGTIEARYCAANLAAGRHFSSKSAQLLSRESAQAPVSGRNSQSEGSLSAAQLEMAQQYNRSPTGYPPLLQWARDDVRRLHAPPAKHELLVTLGGNHAAEARSRCGVWTLSLHLTILLWQTCDHMTAHL